MSSPLESIYRNREFNWREYAKLYERYCATSGNYYRLTARAILNRIAIQDSHSIVDAACGTGIFTEEVCRSQSPRIIGIDLSEEALARYASKFAAHARIMPVRGNLEMIDSSVDSPIDQIIAASALWNFKWKEFFPKAGKILKQHGVLSFNVPAAYLGEKSGFLYEVAQTFEKECNTSGKMFSIEDRTLQDVLAASGFKHVEKHAYQFAMSPEALKGMFALFRLRAPFIFFQDDLPLAERQAVTDRTLDWILKQWQKGHVETGHVYVCKK